MTLTAEEKERLRQLLDSELSWTEAKEQTIDEGISSREEVPPCLGKNSTGDSEMSSGKNRFHR